MKQHVANPPSTQDFGHKELFKTFSVGKWERRFGRRITWDIESTIYGGNPVFVHNREYKHLATLFLWKSLPFFEAPDEAEVKQRSLQKKEGITPVSTVGEFQVDNEKELYEASERDVWVKERGYKRGVVSDFVLEKAFESFEGKRFLIPATTIGSYCSWYDVDMWGNTLYNIMRNGLTRKTESRWQDEFFLFILDKGRSWKQLPPACYKKDEDFGEVLFADMIQIKMEKGVERVYPIHDLIYYYYVKKGKIMHLPIVIGELEFLVNGKEPRVISPTMEQLGVVLGKKYIKEEEKVF